MATSYSVITRMHILRNRRGGGSGDGIPLETYFFEDDIQFNFEDGESYEFNEL